MQKALIQINTPGDEGTDALSDWLTANSDKTVRFVVPVADFLILILFD